MLTPALLASVISRTSTTTPTTAATAATAMASSLVTSSPSMTMSTTSLSLTAAAVAPMMVDACATLAPFAAILVFTAPVSTIEAIRRDRTVRNLPLLPYSSMVASAFLWTVYGILLRQPKIWSCNGIGAALGMYYMAQFVRFSPRSSPTLPGSIRQHVLGVTTIVTLTVLVAFVVPFLATKNPARTIIGPVGVALTIGMFASPLSALTTVIRTKSASSIPLPFTLASLLNCFLWSVAGIFQLKDPNVIVPNVMGLLCSMAQATLKIIYRNTADPGDEPLLKEDGVAAPELPM